MVLRYTVTVFRFIRLQVYNANVFVSGATYTPSGYMFCAVIPLGVDIQVFFVYRNIKSYMLFINKMDGIVKLVYPYRSSNKVIVRLSLSQIPPSKTDTSVYDIVDLFRDEIFLKSNVKGVDKEVGDRVLLRDIINLHNKDGIRDMTQIRSMTQEIMSGGDIFSADGLPNIKLVETRSNEWVLFDGHHSMLAYMLAGKKYLDEVPHLIVEDAQRIHVSDKEILVFFGKHKAELKSMNWREYVINWQAKEENQLQKRVQNDMGGLLESLTV